MRRIATIDIGTNSVRLMVVEIDEEGSYRLLDQERQTTRLGEGLYGAGQLTEVAMSRTLDALSKMKAISDGFGVDELRAVATSAVREARNGGDFCRRARELAGLTIEVISAEEEALLAFRSATRQLRLADRAVAVVDIGGGSVEVILAAGTVIDQIYSLPLGAVRVTESYVKSDPLTDEDWQALKKGVDKRIRQEIGKPPITPELMVGSGGTFTTLAGIVKAEREGRVGGVQGYSLTLADVVHVVERLREMPLTSRTRIQGLDADRADIIVAGAAVVARLARRLRARQIVINDGGIREGLLLQVSDRYRRGVDGGVPEDRMHWIRVFGRKCRWHEQHSEHVARLAAQLFDAVRERYGLPDSGRDVLRAAALLHDIGYVIGHAKHHKHAYHLIMHSDLPGFSAEEVELIANVARYHRRALPKKKHKNFRRLAPGARDLVRKLSGILRVADGLDRTHAQVVEEVSIESGDGRMRLVVDASEDPAVDLWAARRKSELFERVYDAELEFSWRGESNSVA